MCVTRGDSNSLVSDLMGRSYIPKSLKVLVASLLGLERAVNRLDGDRKGSNTTFDAGRLRAATGARNRSNTRGRRATVEKFNFHDSNDHQLAALHQTDEHRQMRESLDAGHKPRRTRKRDIVKNKASAIGKRVSRFMGVGDGPGPTATAGKRFSKFAGAFGKRGGGGGLGRAGALSGVQDADDDDDDGDALGRGKKTFNMSSIERG